MNHKRLCSLCDEWYDETSDRAKIHLHPEPQSGLIRERWLRSGLSYEKWLAETFDGNLWAITNRFKK